MKFQDTNANGVKDAGEPGLATWVINAYADTVPDGVLSVAEFTAGPAGTSTTDASGNYSIGALTPGKYVVCEVLQAGWIQSSGGGADECTGSATLGADGYAITLTSGQTDADNDFGNYQNATKTGMKFQDTNANGVKDAGEPGLATWVINAYADTVPDGVLSVAEFTAGPAGTSTTDASGNYSIGALTPGKYVVVRGPPDLVDPELPGWCRRVHRLATLGADGYAITLTSGQTDADNDFGNYQNATKTGMKFNDLNANGVKDAGEPGLATWVINAYADTVPDGVLSVAEFTAGPAGIEHDRCQRQLQHRRSDAGQVRRLRGSPGRVDPVASRVVPTSAPARRPSALTATPSR